MSALPATVSPIESLRNQYPHSEIEAKAIDNIAKDNIARTILFYAGQQPRTIALRYQNFVSRAPVVIHLYSTNKHLTRTSPATQSQRP